jgi:predicted DCC family thiol-disulfide oxidoreductase YuxK
MVPRNAGECWCAASPWATGVAPSRLTDGRPCHNMIPMGITLLERPGRLLRTTIDRSGTLLYDSDCGICLATAGLLAKRVVPSRLGLLALSEAATESRIERLTRGRPLTTTIHFVRADDAVLTGARAVLAAVRLVPRWRFVAIALDNALGHAFLEPLYRQIATHRRRIGRLFGLPVSCPLPPRKGESV